MLLKNQAPSKQVPGHPHIRVTQALGSSNEINYGLAFNVGLISSKEVGRQRSFNVTVRMPSQVDESCLIQQPINVLSRRSPLNKEPQDKEQLQSILNSPSVTYQLPQTPSSSPRVMCSLNTSAVGSLLAK
jgi:hypothetical protein